MASKNFLLVSLEEDKAKQLAQIVSNDICRKILDYLSSKEHATETAIAKDLVIAISTVHYNLKQLLQSGIVKAGEFHYSEKGKEVLHYSLANRYIIIAPKATVTETLANKLKRILPVVAVVAATGFAIQVYNTVMKAGTFASYNSAQKAADIAAPAMQEAARQAAGIGNESATTSVGTAMAQAVPNIALWFVAGAVFAIAAYLVVDGILRKGNR
ncbi:TPA: helix-turn-helix transcriptional regulator [Candidatus Woesearchaeota archaeon]|nr:helix-turn-helix transcriptional regulator [Candidatus Woesearchaeota archaeon]